MALKDSGTNPEETGYEWVVAATALGADPTGVRARWTDEVVGVGIAAVLQAANSRPAPTTMAIRVFPRTTRKYAVSQPGSWPIWA
jgi:hypothetical protein